MPSSSSKLEVPEGYVVGTYGSLVWVGVPGEDHPTPDLHRENKRRAEEREAAEPYP